jgi:hypothetical protein
VKKLATADLPAAWLRAGKLTARALLRAELEALRLFRTALRAGMDRALAALAVLPMGDSRRTTAERVVEVLRGHLPALLIGLHNAIANGRLVGKRAALSRLDAEWDQVRVEVQRAKFADPGPLRVSASLTANDNVGADVSAASLSAAWLSTATAATWTWSEADSSQSLAGAVGEASLGLDGRVRRIAATETARAFADGRDEGTGWVAEKHQDARWFPAVLKRWDATNDRRVCPRCAAMDGKLQLFGLPFAGRQEPGYVHAHDRCVTAIVFLPVRIRGEVEPGRQVDDEQPREAA